MPGRVMVLVVFAITNNLARVFLLSSFSTNSFACNSPDSDAQGRERGVLSAHDNGAFLSLLDLKGSPTSLLTID
jgi:hypothetical protein